MGLLLLSGLSDGISLIMVYKELNSWPIVNLFFLAQFVVMYFVFSSEYRSRFNKVAFCVFFVYAIVNYFFLQTPGYFNSNTSYAGALIMLLLALFYLFRLFRELPVERVQDLPMLWISFAVLIYFGGTLFLFLFNNYLITNEPGTHRIIWVLHNMLNVAKNVFLSIALWKHYRQTTSPG
jgi:hypothetical protein